MPYIEVDNRCENRKVHLYYERMRGDPASTPIVFLHELGGTAASWKAVARQLPDKYERILLEVRNSGRSEHVVRPFGFKELVDDVIGASMALQLRRPFVLAGLAMGAITAMYTALRYKDALKALVVSDGAATLKQEAKEYVAKRMEKVRREGMRGVVDESIRNSFGRIEVWGNHRIRQEYWSRFMCNCPDSYIAQSRALLEASIGIEALASIKVPSLIMVGEADHIFPSSEARFLAANLATATYVEIPESAHFPPMQNSQATAIEIKRFMEELNTARK